MSRFYRIDFGEMPEGWSEASRLVRDDGTVEVLLTDGGSGFLRAQWHPNDEDVGLD